MTDNKCSHFERILRWTSGFLCQKILTLLNLQVSKESLGYYTVRIPLEKIPFVHPFPSLGILLSVHSGLTFYWVEYCSSVLHKQVHLDPSWPCERLEDLSLCCAATGTFARCSSENSGHTLQNGYLGQFNRSNGQTSPSATLMIDILSSLWICFWLKSDPWKMAVISIRSVHSGMYTKFDSEYGGRSF